MKRIIALLMAMAMCVSLVACGNSEKQDDSKKGENDVSNSEVQDDGRNFKLYDEFPCVYQSNAMLIDIEDAKPDDYCWSAPSPQAYPGNCSFDYEGEYAVLYGEYDISYEYGKGDMNEDELNTLPLEEITSPNLVAESMQGRIAESLGNFSRKSYDYTLEYHDGENVKINGYDMYKVKGTMHATSIYGGTPDFDEVEFVLYCVIKADLPIFFGVVDMPEDEITADIEDVADKIATTFRDLEDQYAE